MKMVALLLFSTLFFASCGQEARSRRSAEKSITIDPAQIEYMMAHQGFSCAESGTCLEGVGKMFSFNMKDAVSSHTCTAFLVAPDLVMTNSHCVYQKRLSTQEACEGMHFSFPHQYGIENARCSSILWQDLELKNDFALVRLDTSLSITPLSLSEESLTAGATVYPMVVDQVSDYDSKLLKLSCRVAELTPRYGGMMLENCPVIYGNSGSPVLDQNKKVVGIIFASSSPEVRKATDSLTLRRQSTSEAYAFTMDYIRSHMDALENL